MSCIKQHQATQQCRVEIPPPKSLPPNPLISNSLQDFDRAFAANISATGSVADTELVSEAKEDKTLRYRLLASDQRSFFTGSAAADLQAAHILNAIRKNPNRREIVQRYLTQQKLHDPRFVEFLLDNVENAILLEASLHVQWDLYGTFCFVPTSKDAVAILEALRTINEAWVNDQDRHGRLGRNAPRPLNVSLPPFVGPRWEIVILHHSALLPDDQPIAIAENRHFISRSTSVAPPPRATWKFWVALGDSFSLLGDPTQLLPPFTATNLRNESENVPPISSLAMIVNAHSKLRPYLEQHGATASDRVKDFADVISRIVEEIFFIPDRGYEDVAENILPSRPTGPLTATNVPLPQPGGAGPQAGFTQFRVENYIHSPALAPVQEAIEGPETPDDDGLTISEFNLLNSKANNPHLARKERSDAAMMMMFGAHGYANPFNNPLQT